MASSLLFYMGLYATTMLCITLDTYLAIAAPLWHRIHLRRRRAIIALIAMFLLNALCSGVFLALTPDELFQYYPSVFLCFLSSDTKSISRSVGWMTLLLFFYGLPSTFVVLMNVLTYVCLRRLASHRLKLGVRPVQVEIREPATIQQQQIVDSQVPNAYHIDYNYTTVESTRNGLNVHSECIELQAVSSIDLRSDNLSKLAKIPFPENRSQGNSAAIEATPKERPNHQITRVTDCGLKFKLTFLLSLRYLLVYSMAEVIAFVLIILTYDDASNLLFYMFFINGFGDYVLYGIFNTRYRASHMKIHIEILSYICKLHLNSHPKLQQIIFCILLLS